MNAVVTLDEFRKNLSDIVGKVMYGNQTVIVQKHNKTGVVVISEREYESLRDPRKRFTSQEDWNKLFLLTDNVKATMSSQEQELLETIVDEEVKTVRTQNQQKKL